MPRTILSLLTIGLLMPMNAFGAVTLTFSGNVNGNDTLFSVQGDVYGSNDVLSPGTWNDEKPIAEMSSWTLLDDIAPSSYLSNENSYAQMFATTGGSFRYHELRDGSNPIALEAWSHEVDIRTIIFGSGGTIESLLNVAGAFSYSELVGFATNYTQDGSTIANTQQDRIDGTLTLVDFELSDDSGGGAIPEPATITIWGLGALGCAVATRRREV
jgi:hypothetical protein